MDVQKRKRSLDNDDSLVPSKAGKISGGNKGADAKGMEDLPMELLKKILWHITDIQDVWHSAHVSPAFAALVWENVEKLEFVFVNGFRSDPLGRREECFFFIRQSSTDHLRFGGKLDKLRRCLLTIWEKSSNITELGFRNIDRACAEAENIGEVDPFVSHILNAQETHPKQVARITFNDGVEKISDLCAIIGAFSNDLTSLVVLGTYHNNMVSANASATYYRALSQCGNLESGTIESDILFGPFLGVGSLKELNCYGEDETGICLQASIEALSGSLSGLDHANPYILLRMDGRFLLNWHMFHVSSRLTRVTLLVMQIQYNDFCDFFPVLLFHTTANYSTAMCRVQLSHTDVPPRNRNWDPMVLYLEKFKDSETVRKLTVVLSKEPENMRARELRRTVQNVKEELGVRGEIVRLSKVDELGGLEVPPENGGGLEQYFKIQLGSALCFMGPLSDRFSL